MNGNGLQSVGVSLAFLCFLSRHKVFSLGMYKHTPR